MIWSFEQAANAFAHRLYIFLCWSISSPLSQKLLWHQYSCDQCTADTRQLGRVARRNVSKCTSSLLLNGISITFFVQICRNINRIKVCMETGRTVILLNLESLYESLYDALNQVRILISFKLFFPCSSYDCFELFFRSAISQAVHDFISLLQKRLRVLLNTVTFLVYTGNLLAHTTCRFSFVYKRGRQLKLYRHTYLCIYVFIYSFPYFFLFYFAVQYYVYFGGQKYVDLGLGTHRVKCRVHDDFR